MCERRACSAERKQPRCSVRFGRTEPSPSGQDGPPSKPNRACKPPSRARAEGLLGLLGLITGLATYVNPPWYFYLPTGSITVEATCTQVTVATLKPQTAYVVYISSL